MTAFSIVAVFCLFAIGAQALITKHLYHEKILLEDKDHECAFQGLDVWGTDKQICDQDLSQHYYHPKLTHAKKRFIEWIDSEDADKTVNPEELKKFMSNQMVTLACHECKFVRSNSLKSVCYADQLLTYVALVIPYKVADSFFGKIESNDPDKEIDLAEMQKYLTDINAAADLKFDDDDVKNLMLEIGGSDLKINAQEWREYLTQEELHDNFRICRTKLIQENCEVEYDNPCMMKETLHFTRDKLTELDTEDVFHVFDTNTNGFIEAGEIKNGIPDCDEEFSTRMFKMMDLTGDKKISYAEFRVFMRDHWVKIEMEKDCSSQKKTQEDEVECYVGQMKELVTEQYSRIWMGNPDLDMVIAFEHLDHNDNGRIEEGDDLLTHWKWNEQAAKNFIAEMDGPDKNVHVSLEEFNEAVDEPHMVYATADCMDYILKEKPKRADCYKDELHDTYKDMMLKETVKSFFDFYDTNHCGKITKDEVAAHNVEPEDVTNFMQEMAMGDDKVNLREFSWYVKQQRINHMFVDAKCNGGLKEMHVVLLSFHENVMTEYDTQEVFKALDHDHDFELTEKDCAGHDPLKHQSLLERIDRPDDNDKTVNFVEFWLFLNTPMGPEPRKTSLEKTCTEEHEKQEDEMNCYLTHIWEVK